MSRSRVTEALAAVALLASVLLLIWIVTLDKPSDKLSIFEGSSGFVMISEPPTAVNAFGYMSLSDRRDAGASEGEVAMTADAEFSGVGTYGGTLADTCDVGVLKAHLLADDDTLSQSWATAAGISANGVGDFLDGLSASVLTTPRTLSLHGLDDGQRISFTTLIEAGTAVLVDADGVPRVRCLDGSPVTSSPDVAAVTAAAPNTATDAESD